MRDSPLSITTSFDEDKIQLPFSAEQQEAFVGYAMLNEDFWKKIQGRLKPSWFIDPHVSKIYKFWDDFWKKYDRIPLSQEEFLGWEPLVALNQLDKNNIKKFVGLCKTRTVLYGLDYLSDQLTEWMKTQVFYRDLPQIANLLNSQQVGKAEALLHQSAREIQVTRFHGEPPTNWKDWRGLMAVTELDVANSISTGLSSLDRHLLPEANGKGGLLAGDTTVIVAPVNSGKTSCMITIARHAVVDGRSVLFLTREGRDADIQQKVLQCMSRKTKSELRAFSRTPEGEHFLDIITAQMSERLDHIHMPKVGMEVEEAISIIHSMQALRKAKTGKGYDMLVVDYPGIFVCGAAKGAKWDFRIQQDYIYRQFVQLGLEEKFHVLVAAQTNREGYKVNREKVAKRLLTLEDISEAFGIAMSATNVITLNRDEKSQMEHRLTFYVVKSRSSETGWAVTCRSDYARGMTHSNELGGTAFRGNGSMADIIESLMKKYSNCDVPEGYVQGLRKAD